MSIDRALAEQIIARPIEKTINLTPVNEWWTIEEADQFNRSGIDNGRPEGSIFFTNRWYDITPTSAVWKLRKKIRIKDIAPGKDHRLSYVAVEIKQSIGWGTFEIIHERYFAVKDDKTGRTLFEARGGQLKYEPDKYAKNEFTLDVSIDPDSVIDALLGVDVDVETGGVTYFYSGFKLGFKYITESAPVSAIVEIYVLDVVSGKPVQGALVTMIQGGRIVASGTTDQRGFISFSNVPTIEEGLSYEIVVRKEGYYTYSEYYIIKPGYNMINVSLAQIPKPPSIIPQLPESIASALPWIIAVGAVGATAYISYRAYKEARK